jgi:hypothetical protein
MTTDLITGPTLDAQFRYSQTAEDLKLSALALSAVIGKVTNSTENEQAVIAQSELKRVLDLAETARVHYKQPFLDHCRAIDTKAKQFTAEMRQEFIRVSALVGNFQQLELSKQKAIEAQRSAELTDIERRREEQLASASSHEEREAIQERACQEAQMLPAVPLAKAKGQVLAEDYEIEVTNGLALANAFPQCVTIEPKLREIKALLKAGLVRTIPGVIARPVVKAGVRLPREPEAITV